MTMTSDERENLAAKGSMLKSYRAYMTSYENNKREREFDAALMSILECDLGLSPTLDIHDHVTDALPCGCAVERITRYTEYRDATEYRNTDIVSICAAHTSELVTNKLARLDFEETEDAPNAHPRNAAWDKLALLAG